jgi:predicted acylesterase/phospholipase RssA
MMTHTSDTPTQTAREAWQVLDQRRRGVAGTDTIGLVVQGGGMRGVYSMGALAALEEMGFGQCFDHVAGSSAGALNGAYFITGQASYGVETYIHYLSRKIFVNPFRFKKVVDIDDHGHIKVTKHCETSVRGIYAAGDVTDIHEYQYIIAGGQGCKALLSAARCRHKRCL